MTTDFSVWSLSIPDYILNEHNHESDNYILRADTAAMLESLLSDSGFTLRGFCKNPPFSYTKSVGLVYEDEYFETRWVHLPYLHYCRWLKDLGFTDYANKIKNYFLRGEAMT